VKFSGDEHKWKFGPAAKTVWRRREKVIRHREEAKLEKDFLTTCIEFLSYIDMFITYSFCY
jgi:hypothetical protein